MNSVLRRLDLRDISCWCWQLTDELMIYRNAPPQAPATILAASVATPDHVWRARLAREQAEKMEALDQAQVAELM